MSVSRCLLAVEGTPLMSLNADITDEAAGVEGGLERRQVHVAQGLLGDVDGVVVHARPPPRRRRRSAWRWTAGCRARSGRGPGSRAPRPAAITSPRNTSSPAPSATRPQRWSRATSTIGRRSSGWPAAWLRPPPPAPCARPGLGSKLAARPAGSDSDGLEAVDDVGGEQQRDAQAQMLDGGDRSGPAAAPSTCAIHQGSRYLVARRCGHGSCWVLGWLTGRD